MTTPAANPRSSLTDLAGTAASTLCAVHCGAVALLPGVLAAAGLAWLLNEDLEWLFVATAAALGSCAAWLGYAAHRRHVVVWWLLLSSAGLLVSRLLEAAELPGGVAVGLLSGVSLAIGHLSNLRATRACRAC